MQLQVKQIYNPRFIAPNEIRTAANISRRQNLTNFYDNDEKINDFWILINPKILRGVKRLNNNGSVRWNNTVLWNDLPISLLPVKIHHCVRN